MRTRAVVGLALAVSLLPIAWPGIVPPGGIVRSAAEPVLPACAGAATPGAAPAGPTPRAGSGTPVGSGAGVLQSVADVPLPGDTSRFDYQSLDPTTGWLWIAHMGADQLVVFDTHSRKVIGSVDDLPDVTGVLAVPELGRVYASVFGDHRVAIINARTLAVVERLGHLGFPDGMDYAPGVKRLFVSDESGGGELVLDAATNSVVETIDLEGEAGNTYRDAGSGCIFVAVQNNDQLVALDPASDRVVGRFDLGGDCQGPHGFQIDAPARLAFVTCEDNARLLVIDLTTMQSTADFGVGNRPDLLAFDPGLDRLYVASEAGVVSVFSEEGRRLHPLGEYRAPHAHSVAVDPTTHLVYLPLEDAGGHPVLRILAPSV